jgi:hypothetical protein
MLNTKNNTFNVRIQSNIADYTVVIDSGSLVIDNKWIDFKGVLFNIKQYLRNAVTGSRVRFFTNVNYAGYLVLGIDVTGALIVLEGAQVSYTTLASVPIPPVFSMVPIAGIVVIQDGSNNLIDGINPITDSNVIFYSGMGNTLDKNQKGIMGFDSNILGDTGLCGQTGYPGLDGDTGLQGLPGIVGPVGFGFTGLQGSQGLTGINWDIAVGFNILL